MNTTQLQCFTALAGTLNYVRAAEELHMSQPAVTRQIQSLENELGAKLIERNTRNVSLTDIGAQFLPEAQSMLKEYYHSVEWISTFHARIQHALRVGYADSNALVHISEMLSPILEQQGNISPEFSLDQTDANLHKLASGELDLIYGIKDAKFSDDSISFTPLHDEHFHCVCNKEHPLAALCRKKHVSSVSKEDMLPYRQIISIPPYLLRNAFSRGNRIIPVNENLSNIIVSDSSEAYCLVLANAGYALLPDHLLITNKNLKILDWKESPHAMLGIYCRKDALKDRNTTVYKAVQITRST